MHVLESEKDLSSVKSRSRLVKRPLVHSVQVIEQFTAVYKLHHHVKLTCVLERELHLHDERMVESTEDISLGCRTESQIK